MAVHSNTWVGIAFKVIESLPCAELNLFSHAPPNIIEGVRLEGEGGKGGGNYPLPKDIVRLKTQAQKS